MQISSTIQVPGEINPETIQDTLVWETKGSKKEKSGLFARLLDGLTGKSRKVTGNNKVQSGENHQFMVKIPDNDDFQFVHLGDISQNKKDTNSFPLKTLSVTGKNIEIPGKTEIDPFLKSGEQKNIPLRPLNPKENRQLNTPSAKEWEVSVLKESMFLGEEKKAESGEEALPQIKDGMKGRPGRAAVDMFPGRNLETRSFEPSGMPRPALVDTIAAFDKSGENREGVKKTEGRSKRNERLNIEVRDLRTGESRPVMSSESLGASGLKNERTEIEIPLELSLSGSRETGGKTGEGSSFRANTFEEALAQELRTNLNTDIVQQASIIVRNGGEGTIRLSLKPESLGNVKIRLEMAENKITGHIIVESSEALRAFERELPVLEKAFKDSGFSETNLQMSLAQDGWNSRAGGERQEGDFHSLSPVLAASRYEAETEWIEEPPIEGGFAFSTANGRTPVNLLV